ncbi:MAG: M12 family metallo-peptidase [Thermoanaerobaculia bacterium]
MFTRSKPTPPLAAAVAATLLLLGVTAFAAPEVAAAAYGKRVTDAANPNLAAIAQGLPDKASLRVEDLFLTGLGSVDLELERFRVFAEDAEIHSGGVVLAAPDNAYYRGTLEGLPGSMVVLSFRQRGGIGGIVLTGGDYWKIEGRRGVAGLESRRVDSATDFPREPFDCLADGLPSVGLSDSSRAGGPQQLASPPPQGATSYAARVAVETDWEFLDLFSGNEAAATDYVGDLFAFSSSVYEAEIDTGLLVSFLRLWPGTADSDLWSATDCTNQLYEFRDHWRDNEGGQTRAIAHMLSGKSTGCGIAYVGALCSTSYGYGVSGSLRGNFDPANPMPAVWDIIVVSHEIGHNFSSPHTHCYQGIPDASYSDAVDPCYSISGSSSCYSGTADLPAGCPGAGQACGTIMSYCHLRSGGYGNIALTFGGSVLDGSSHAYGAFPERVPEKMHGYVLAKAASGCLDPVLEGPTLSVGKTGTGSGTVTSSPAGISCGSDCSETYPEGTQPAVVLTATPAAGSVFTSWSGDCSGSSPDFSITVSTDKSCTASFDSSSSCGNGVKEPGEVCDGNDLGGATCPAGCGGGPPTCNATCDGIDYSSCVCDCDFDGVCEDGEDCGNCPSDCASGTTSGAICGNGLCEAGNGEDCRSCPTDCRGYQRGKPSGRYCCGDGQSAAACDDPASVCNSSGYECTTTPFSQGSFCCGTGGCEAGESCSNCALDCELGGEICGDGIDNDCDGAADCGDAACSADCPSCKPKGELCQQNSDCCSVRCAAKGNSAPKCR